ncbi:MAG: hypothetical protein HOC71_04020 [Candidatus Latescibacteria bacterium]|jgi:hypothetical protein|nr:hypothetical protein [Candidatus Latescibacterota bacterium]
MFREMEMNIPPLKELMASIPKEELTEEVYQRICYFYAWEVSHLLEMAHSAERPSISFLPFTKSGSQFIANFWLNDLTIPKENSYNFHGQNTSQWKYAGCILYQDGRVSTHH